MRIALRSKYKRTTIPFMAGLLAAVTLLGSAGLLAHKVSAADFSGNAIMYGGCSTAAACVQQIRNNNGGHHADIATVYSDYGLAAANYDKFVSNSVPGTDYRDGHITVQNNGQEVTVATGATSIGRQLAPQGPGAFHETIGGTTYYGNTNDRAFAAGVNSLPVQVFFNDQGVMQFAVIKDCGNPTRGTPVHPAAACHMLNMTKSTTKANTYNFSTQVTQNENLFTKFVYNYGDGTTQTTTSPNTVVTHTYSKAGSFKVTVTPYVKLPGNPERPIAVGPCVRTITIVQPYLDCVSVKGAITDASKYSVNIVVTVKYGNGAIPNKAVVTYGDGQTVTLTKLTTPTTYTVSHIYTARHQYNIAATIYGNNSTITSQTCTATVTPTTPPTPTCKPGIPVGDVRCNPCETNPSVPATDTQDCQAAPPPSLPNTGAGNTIAIFAAVVVAGFLVYRTVLYRQHKAAFLAAQQGSSPLPLGDPLSDTPLADTPLAPKLRKSFRRNRPF